MSTEEHTVGSFPASQPFRWHWQMQAANDRGELNAWRTKCEPPQNKISVQLKPHQAHFWFNFGNSGIFIKSENIFSLPHAVRSYPRLRIPSRLVQMYLSTWFLLPRCASRHEIFQRQHSRGGIREIDAGQCEFDFRLSLEIENFDGN